MKRPVTLVISGLLCLSSGLHAQQSTTSTNLFNESVDLNIGNIIAPHLVHGDMWWNPVTGTSPIQFPKGISGQLKGVSAIWVGGKESNGQVLAATQDYRSKGSDFWPGPVGQEMSTMSNQHTIDWARIWRINSSSIDAFLALGTHTLANTPTDILEWPGKGNVYARGAQGAYLRVTRDMAPFVDVNANGVYEPLYGDYPKMKGSQMLWWVLNDYSLHPNSRTATLKLEVRISAYAYAKETIADNIIFYEYDMQHALGETLREFVFAPMGDFDISDALNDNVGYDPVRRVAAMYDADNDGSPSRHIAAGYALLDQPGDTWKNYTPAGAMNFLRTEARSPDSDPENGQESYFVMQGRDRLGNPRHPLSRYAYSSLDAQCFAGAPPGDQSIILATAPVDFSPGQHLHFAYAFVAADSSGLCPTVRFARLEQTVDTALKVYWNPERHTPTSVRNAAVSDISLFPNPAQATLHLSGRFPESTSIIVLNTMGARMDIPAIRDASGVHFATDHLPAGIYHVRLSSDAESISRSFVKR